MATSQQKLLDRLTKYGQQNDLSVLVVDFQKKKCIFVRRYTNGEEYFVGEYKSVPGYTTRRITTTKLETWFNPDWFNSLTNH